jgi:hypothetical protein
VVIASRQKMVNAVTDLRNLYGSVDGMHALIRCLDEESAEKIVDAIIATFPDADEETPE